MQNKGAIKIFAIALALVCLFQISFTIVTMNVEKKATRFAFTTETEQEAAIEAKGQFAMDNFGLPFDSLTAEQQSQVLNNPKLSLLQDLKYQVLAEKKRANYLDSMSREVVYNILIRKYTFRECKEREINLGLDLKGGMNVTMEISVADIVRGMSGNSKDPVFNKAIEMALAMQKNSTEDFVTLFGKAFKELDPQAKLSSPTLFGKAELKDRINYNTSNDEVLNIIRKEADASVDRTFNILRTRIDRFGVSQPNIQKLGNTGRILIELPGVKEPERVRKLLQGTAKLEFWETYEYAQIYRFLEEANTKLKQVGSAVTDTLPADSNAVVEDIVADTLKNDTASTTDSNSLDNLANDTTELGKQQSFEKFAKENPLFAYLNPSLVQDEKGNYYPAQGPVAGYALIKDTAKINNMLNLSYIKAILPGDLKFLWTVKPIDKEETTLQLIAIRITSRDQVAPLTGEVIVDARQDYSQNGKPEILMIMNSDGARTWKRLTAENIEKSIAIVLDDYVYSFPTVQSEIPNGRSSISGNFTIQEAQDLANILKAGSLPAPARIVEEAIVGPSLGKEAISKGFISFVIAFCLVLAYMYFFYNKAGLVADLALISNMFFMIGILASLGAVLTLPGIAGIVLTLGMAVDANVIIYERILEEMRAGKAVRLAIEDGYKNAYSAIIDGNVTTLLTGIVLFVFGSGPVQGFATTLIIGILTSLFTAIFFSRLIFLWMLSKNMTINFCNSFTNGLFAKFNINFFKKRKLFYGISLTIIVIGIISLFIRGLNYGVDFSGGRSFVVRFDQDVNTATIRNLLAIEFGEAPEVKTFGPNNQIKITTKYLIDENTAEADSVVEQKIYNAINKQFKAPITFNEFIADEDGKLIGRLSSQKVGPTVARDIKQAAILAVFFSLIIIFVYIAVRFNKWYYGLGGVIALFHDTLIVISVYSLFYNILPFSLDVDQTFIAAILTIIGYSINDTVIIFDRIRENIKLFPKRDFEFNMNTAINSTLGRTINTSGTTLIVLLAIMIFGGDIIRGFAFSLFVGITVGTYSSVFIANATVLDMVKARNRRKEKAVK